MNMIDTYDKTMVLPYKTASKGAKSLAQALEVKRIKLENSRYRAKKNHLVINWGNCKSLPFNFDQEDKPLVLNPPETLAKMSNKLSFFRHFEGKDWLPRFWTKQEDIPDDAFPIVCRQILNGHSGRGIVIANGRDDLVPCPLYVEYIKKKDEYRVHVGSYNDGSGGVEYRTIAIQQKKRKTTHENPNWQVRNLSNGFIYARENVEPPIRVVECAVDCLDGSGLDFGAVDVIWNQNSGKAYVLEINSAPGLEGSTLDDYVKYFKGLV